MVCEEVYIDGYYTLKKVVAVGVIWKLLTR
jgi:hypothetical protein